MKRAESNGRERAIVEGLEERRMMSVSSLTSIPDGTSNITDGTSNTIYVSAANGGVWKDTADDVRVLRIGASGLG